MSSTKRRSRRLVPEYFEYLKSPSNLANKAPRRRAVFLTTLREDRSYAGARTNPAAYVKYADEGESPYSVNRSSRSPRFRPEAVAHGYGWRTTRTNKITPFHETVPYPSPRSSIRVMPVVESRSHNRDDTAPRPIRRMGYGTVNLTCHLQGGSLREGATSVDHLHARNAMTCSASDTRDHVRPAKRMFPHTSSTSQVGNLLVSQFACM